MPMSTLELPTSMVDAARSYAASENRSVAELFADLMKSRYGFTMSFTVSRPTPKRQPGALRGCIRIAEDFDESTDELVSAFENSSVVI